MRISDWSSDVCSSDLFDEQAVDVDVAGRQQRVFAAAAGHARGVLRGLCGQRVLVCQRVVIAFECGNQAFAVGGAGLACDLRAAFGEPFDFLQLDPVPGRVADDGIEAAGPVLRSEEHTSELQSLMRISYAVFCLKKKK